MALHKTNKRKEIKLCRVHLRRVQGIHSAGMLFVIKMVATVIGLAPITQNVLLSRKEIQMKKFLLTRDIDPDSFMIRDRVNNITVDTCLKKIWMDDVFDVLGGLDNVEIEDGIELEELGLLNFKNLI